MTWQSSRRHFLRASAAMVGSGLLQACASNTQTLQPIHRSNTSHQNKTVQPIRHSITQNDGNTLHVVAPSGYAENTARVELGLSRLGAAGFVVSNQQAAYRRYQRFAGTDAERAADFQAVASGRVETPKVMMGLRGGYGAMRILPAIDFASLGARMKERGTLFSGFSDVCAIQLALLAQGNMCSFAGPMVYSEFGKPAPSVYTMDSFIQGATNPSNTIQVAEIQRRDVRVDGVMWGGNLSVLAALAGSPYMPNISGGILFVEDVGEQPYRIERMLQTLYLAGVLSKQQAIVFGNFRMSTVRDVYDSSYDLSTVMANIQRVARVPVLTGFPFGHVSNKTFFPLGAHAKIRATGDGGYSVAFSDYPTLNKANLFLDTLLPSVSSFDSSGSSDDGVTE